MNINKLYQYLDTKHEVILDTRMFVKGTIIKIKSIDIRKTDHNRLLIRFRCTTDNSKEEDCYLDPNDFISGMDIITKELKEGQTKVLKTDDDYVREYCITHNIMITPENFVEEYKKFDKWYKEQKKNEK